VANEDRDEIRRLIDSLQAGMVEMFDQLRELRRRLNFIDDELAGATSSAVQLFTEVKKPKAPIVPSTPSPPNTSAPDQSVEERTEKSVSPSIASVVIDTPETGESNSEKHPPISDARVARVLDPITHELRTGEAPAEVLAEYLQAAKDYLFSDETSFNKVSSDMDVVLKFLKAREKKPIRPTERDNILTRIRRWKAALST
jgi:cell division septum initiation protein DivIVA